MHNLLAAPGSFSVGCQDQAVEGHVETSPKGATHHLDVGAEGQQAPQSHCKGKPSTTTAPAAKGRHGDNRTVLLQENCHSYRNHLDGGRSSARATINC